MRHIRNYFPLLAVVLLSTVALAAQTPAPGTGILLLAHGGSKAWDGQVRSVAAEVNRTAPTEVALGMADRKTLQAGVQALEQRGVKHIVAVPLFVSSHSSVIESLRYLLGLRADAPAALAEFAAMGDMSGRAMAMAHHGGGAPAPDAALATTPIQHSVPITMGAALDHSPIVAAILADRAAAIAPDPAKAVLLLVAHGPNDEAANALWLADMQQLAEQIQKTMHYAGVECLTLRDDADPPVRNAATARLRLAATQANAAGRNAVVVPLLLSYGGIENGLRQRLDGVRHTFSPAALLPDPRIPDWVLSSAAATATN